MDQVILMIDTGRAATWRAAEWFKAHGDRVTVITRQAVKHDDIATREVNLMDEAAVQRLVEEMDHSEGRLDVLVMGVPPCAPDPPVGGGHDDGAMLETILYNAQGNMLLSRACLPLLRRGNKRIACITLRESSNAWGQDADCLAMHQCMAGLNMMGKIMFNKLRPEGFTFRWFCEEDEPAPMCAAEYITSQLCYDPDETPNHCDENRLVLRDGFLREIPW